MQVQIKSANGINLIPMETMFFNARKIFLEGEINQELACDFIEKIMLLVSMDEKRPISVMINSPGGEISAGLMIYDIIQSCETPIRLYCIGRAYSMAAVLFASGKAGRYMLPNSELMLHEPLLGNKVTGNSSSLKSISEILLDTKQQMNRILSKHTGKSMEVIEKETSYDHYFHAKESIDFGLCDKIISLNELLEV